MAARSHGATFSVPYEIAAVRSLRQTSSSEREEALRAAHYNTELLPLELIYVDLSTNQLATLSGAELPTTVRYPFAGRPCPTVF